MDGSSACAAALGVAFGTAAQRGLPVTAMHAWSPDVPADHEAVCGPYQVAEERTRADPASVLIRESEGAVLVVVGSRGHGAARAALRGSASRTVAERARCPVVVVRTAKARTAKTWRDQPAEEGRAATVPHIDPAGTDAVRRRRTPWE